MIRIKKYLLVKIKQIIRNIIILIIIKYFNNNNNKINNNNSIINQISIIKPHFRQRRTCLHQEKKSILIKNQQIVIVKIFK